MSPMVLPVLSWSRSNTVEDFPFISRIGVPASITCKSPQEDLWPILLRSVAAKIIASGED